MSSKPRNKTPRGLCLCLLAASLILLTTVVACSKPPVSSSDAWSGPSVASSETTLDPSIAAFNTQADWDVEKLTIENNTQLSDIIVVGEVVQIDTPKWNGPDGKRWYPTDGSPDAIVYTSFYVKPTQVLKGEPKWGAPVAFRVIGVISGSSKREGLQNPLVMEVGDQVVAFGMIDEKRWGGGVYDPAEAYWLTNSENSIWAREDGQFVNKGLTRYPAEKSLSLASLTSEILDTVSAQQ